ncbi:MAG: hypothetical protein HRU19_22150 [Pseudobacteriovorax sp.]|nr:hypothetical protein [Pseudobacteriovorax sp.]
MKVNEEREQVSQESDVSQDEISPKSRRHLFRSLLGVAGAAAIAACENDSDFAGGIRDRDAQNAAAEAANPARPDAIADVEEVPIPLVCDVSLEGQIVVDDIPLVKADMEPTFRIFGTIAKGMLSFAFAGYTLGEDPATNLQSISVIRGDGKLLGTRFLTGSDFDSDGKMRPVVFNDLGFANIPRFSVVAKFADDKQLKYVSPPAISIVESTFKNLPVVSVLPGLIDPTFAANQAIGNFTNGVNGFQNSNDPTKVFQDRPLRTAQADATFTAAPGLNGFIITDLVGREIVADGAAFTDIIEYQSVVAYKLSDDGTKYYRTIIRLG